jgi:hypothetical protein
MRGHGCHLGRSASTTTYSSLSLSLSLTIYFYMAAAPAVALLLLLLLLVVLLIIALLLLPENTQRLSVEQRKAWCGELTYRASTSWRYLGAAPS